MRRYEIECKLTISGFDGITKSKITIPIDENFELWEPDGVELVSRACIYSMLGLGQSAKSIRSGFSNEINATVFDQTGEEG